MLSPSQSYLGSFGASVRGRSHIQQHRPNEDAWMGMSGAFGTAIVISDGMGSKSNARIGAQMACQAVKDALKPWAKSRSGTCHNSTSFNSSVLGIADSTRSRRG